MELHRGEPGGNGATQGGAWGEWSYTGGSLGGMELHRGEPGGNGATQGGAWECGYTGGGSLGMGLRKHKTTYGVPSDLSNIR